MNNPPSAKWPLVSVIIPCYNGMKFLPVCLPSVASLDYPSLEIIIIDDLSTDQSVQFIQKNYPQFRLVRHAENRGFATTVDEGIWMSKGKYLFLLNQDTVHPADYLKKCITRLEENPDLAAITGKVYKFDFETVTPSKIIDSVGIVMLKNRRVLDHGQGAEDQGQFDVAGPVFGISGQNALYRRKALEDVAIPVPGREHREIFDRDFFMYKEEVDLAWRLQLFGWQSWYEPTAVAWHGRATSAVRRTNNLEILANRNKMSRFQRYHSLKNRYLMMIKNELPGIYFRHLPIIIFYDILYFGYNLLFDFRNLSAYFAACRQFPKMWRKRRWIMKHHKAKNKDILPWFKKA